MFLGRLLIIWQKISYETLITQESGWGRSAQGKFNFGNLTTGAKWKGDYVRGNDHDAKGNPIKQKFRSYNSMDEYAADKLQFLKHLYDFDENDDINTFTAKLTGKNKGKRRYAEATDYADRVAAVFRSFKNGGVIKAQAGTIVADNTRVVKPIIQERVPRTYQISEQPQFVQDNRSDWERQQSDNYKRQQQENKTLYNNQHLWNWSAPFNNTRVTKDNVKAMFDFNKSAGMSTFAVGMGIANPVTTATSMAGSMVGAGIGNEVAGEKGTVIGGLVGGLFGFSPKRVGKPTTSRQFQSNLVYGSKINGNMPKITQAEAENANLEGYNNALRILYNPTVRETANRNAELSKRIGKGKIIYETAPNEWSEFDNTSEAGLYRMMEMFPNTKVVRTDLGGNGVTGQFRRTSNGDVIEIDNSVDNYADAVSILTHENLHKGRYGEFPIQMEKAKRLIDPIRARNIHSQAEGYLLGIKGEAATNMNDVRTALGLDFGQKYPGWQSVRDMISQFSASSHPKSFVAKSLKQDTPRDYKRIWDALTGKWFMLPIGMSLINLQNNDDDRISTK